MEHREHFSHTVKLNMKVRNGVRYSGYDTKSLSRPFSASRHSRFDSVRMTRGCFYEMKLREACRPFQDANSNGRVIRSLSEIGEHLLYCSLPEMGPKDTVGRPGKV